jgi:hypothetical protein
MASGNQSYLIIGAGVVSTAASMFPSGNHTNVKQFGVSTALYLIRKYPNASVTLVDRDAFDADSRVAASWDWNKVVRADYDDIVYCRMGLEAQDIFESDPLWMPYFHKTGIYWTCRDAYAQSVIDNYKKLGRKADLKAVTVEEAKKLYGGLFGDADYSDVQEVLVNKTSGWGAAGDCLQAVTKEAIRLGVNYVTAEVATLEVDSDGRCTGIKTSRGQSLKADRTILSTGAFTPKLLELSAEKTGVSALRADNRIVAGGIATGMAVLDPEQYKKFANMPVGVQGYSSPLPFIGSLPPTKDRELKWWSQTIFTNTQQVLPGRSISAPPAKPDYGQWDVPEKLRDGIKYASKVFYGRTGENWKKEKHRICW